ncbi:MAG: glycosyltransferase family 2 protein [Deltaproteobacteria bacterium]|nr:glycosyltransferase family 2 protein [Deltaproteobacteria bacterium]
MNIEKIPLSIVVITFNEEKNLRRCLNSASFAQDIVVLDSISKDKTKEISLACGARFYEQTWLGFGRQKKKAVGLAMFDWVLCLDADEEISKDLHDELILRWSELKEDTGYKLPRLSFYLNKWIHHGGWYPDYQLRLFNRKFSQWSEDLIHEKVLSPKTENFKSALNHYVFDDIADQVNTNNKYSSLQSEKMNHEGRRFNGFHFITKPMVKFIECYFYKMGFLDGWVGFIIAISAAYSVFLKWAKLWELKEKRSVK